MTKVAIDAKALTEVAIRGLQDLKGRNIVCMDLRGVDGAVSEYFVLCTGTSDRHVQALADSVQKFLREEADDRPINKEGLSTGEWVLLDYFNVVIHIFQRETRAFFRLEDLWGDADFEVIEDL